MPSDAAKQYVAAKQKRMDLEERLTDQAKRFERVSNLLNRKPFQSFYMSDDTELAASFRNQSTPREVVGTFLPHEELQLLVGAYSAALNQETEKAQAMPEGERESIVHMNPAAWKHVGLID